MFYVNIQLSFPENTSRTLIEFFTNSKGFLKWLELDNNQLKCGVIFILFHMCTDNDDKQINYTRPNSHRLSKAAISIIHVQNWSIDTVRPDEWHFDTMDIIYLISNGYWWCLAIDDVPVSLLSTLNRFYTLL